MAIRRGAFKDRVKEKKGEKKTVVFAGYLFNVYNSGTGADKVREKKNFYI